MCESVSCQRRFPKWYLFCLAFISAHCVCLASGFTFLYFIELCCWSTSDSSECDCRVLQNWSIHCCHALNHSKPSTLRRRFSLISSQVVFKEVTDHPFSPFLTEHSRQRVLLTPFSKFVRQTSVFVTPRLTLYLNCLALISHPLPFFM